jgi:hypothetical protein
VGWKEVVQPQAMNLPGGVVRLIQAYGKEFSVIPQQSDHLASYAQKSEQSCKNRIKRSLHRMWQGRSDVVGEMEEILELV